MLLSDKLFRGKEAFLKRFVQNDWIIDFQTMMDFSVASSSLDSAPVPFPVVLLILLPRLAFFKTPFVNSNSLRGEV